MLLGITAVALLCAVIFTGLAALQYTRSAVLSNDQKQLSDTTYRLVRAYNNKVEEARLAHQPVPLESAESASSQADLTGISAAVLQSDNSVGVGFYSVSADDIVGSIFPERSNRAGQAPTPPNLFESRATILNVAKTAVAAHAPSRRVVTDNQDTILVDAVPLLDDRQVVGSAWTAVRLSSIPGTNRFRTYLIAAALGITAFACVVLTLLVVRGLQSGVRKIEGGLHCLEHDLSSEIHIEADPAEIRQIALAINRLGATLRDKIENEKQISDRLRHAERLAALGRLVAGVAHEVRNPLATIRLRVQMCEHESSSPEVAESCAVALQEIERLNGIVNRLLNFSRPIHLHTEPANICRLVERRLGNFGKLATERNVRLIAKFNRESKPVRIDESRMAQVFDNIIQNAIDAMSETGGTLCVNVTAEARSEESSEVCVEFNDTGGGIRSDLLSRIFDPFFTTKESGTGLGLSLCHELVQAHGGEINVASAEGCGTTVRVVIPAMRERPPAGRIA